MIFNSDTTGTTTSMDISPTLVIYCESFNGSVSRKVVLKPDHKALKILQDAAKATLVQAFLKFEYLTMCFLNIVNTPRFCRRMIFSLSGFVGRVGKWLKKGK